MLKSKKKWVNKTELEGWMVVALNARLKPELGFVGGGEQLKVLVGQGRAPICVFITGSKVRRNQKGVRLEFSRVVGTPLRQCGQGERRL